MCLLSHFSCVWLSDPKGCSPPSSSLHGIFQARILEWVAISSSRDLPNPGIKPPSLMSPALVGGFFTTSATFRDRHYWFPERHWFLAIKFFHHRKVLCPSFMFIKWLMTLPYILLGSNPITFLNNFNTHLHNLSSISALKFHKLIKCQDLHLYLSNSDPPCPETILPLNLQLPTSYSGYNLISLQLFLSTTKPVISPQDIFASRLSHPIL